MARRPQHWVIGGFILLAVFVVAFAAISLLLSRGFGLPETFLILPAEVTLHPGDGWQFRAVAGDRIMPGVIWTATGDGLIGPEGFYTAPDTPGDYQIFAQHPNSSYRAAATVHVVAAEGVATEHIPSPTDTTAPVQPTTPTTAVAPTVSTTAPTLEEATPPPPTLTPTPTSAPTQTTPPATRLFLDGASDLVNLDTLQPVAIAPSGTDIRATCFDNERRLMQAVPAELAGEISDWDSETNVILWIMFHEPVPAPLDVDRYWIFALDTDANTATGRPLGEGKINPDIGVEATIGVYSNPAAGIELAPYIMVWNTRLGNSEPQTMALEARLSIARDALFVRIPAGSLTETIRTLSGIEPNWDQTFGRTLTTAATSEGTVADFAPERP